MKTSRFTLSGSIFMALMMAAFQAPTYAEITDHTGGALNGYQMVYELNMPTDANYDGTATPNYTVDNSKTVNGLIENVGYYLVLDNNWAFVSMDTFTGDLTKIGVPTKSSGAVFQQKVGNLYYKSNVASLNATDGVHVAQGNIEFWGTNYQQGNTINIPNADAGKFDWGDNRDTGGNYGSMQIHDHQNSTPVICYNRWGQSGANDAVGIGMNSSGEPDWTHTSTAGNYTNRQLGVYVKTLNFDAVTDTAQREIIAGETQNMGIVHKYAITSDGTSSTTSHTIDNSSSRGSLYGMPLARQAYYYELTDKNGNKTYAYTSFDALTNKQEQLGLPTGNILFQETVNNMTVQSNVQGVVNGTGITTGNVEIWGGNYFNSNGNNIPGASGNIYDFGDTMTGGDYGSFQVHNYGAQQTVFALNQFATNNPCVGIGNNPNASTSTSGNPPQKDWTFTNNMNSTYSEVNLYVMAEAAIAPGMANVANGKDFSIVQGGRLTTQMNNNWHNDGFKYDIVDNLATMQSNNVMFDRVGYYIEYSQDGGDLQYAFVSMDAFTDDISKIGVPTANTGIAYQQVVKNLEVTTNLNPANGTLTSGSFSQGFLEFWPSDYGTGKSNIINNGSGSQYDINDNDWNTGAGHGSMQVHNLDTGETVFAINHFNGGKQYGIGTNTSGNGSPDWTFNETKTGYKIANIYTMVRESDAILSTIDAKSGIDFYQRHDNQATVDIAGTLKLASGVTAAKVQAYDGTNRVDMTLNADGSYSGAVTLEGGWHNVNVRAIDGNGSILTSTVTQKIGVGDIFITAGQSNSTNCGDSPQSSTSGNVVALNHVTGEWSIANDPQPITINGAGDGSTRGSSWAPFGDAMSEMSGVPVGIVSVGWSGSNIGQWNPDNVDTSQAGWDTIAYTAGNNTLFGRMAFAIEELDGDFAGILWHQGESNAGSSEEYYEGALNDLIAASREIAGWEVPWGVALVSWRPNGGSREDGFIDENVRNAQQSVIDGDNSVFIGPDSDALLGLFRGENGNSIHFSALGLNELGYLWAATAGKEILGLPEPSTWALMILGVAFLGGTRWMSRLNKKSVA
ncbi:MAG: sialate O-acetylesterase [Planctomycetia bacterium]|nr:sialate O-acetylesterase [Planctomycetia bacterium]